MRERCPPSRAGLLGAATILATIPRDVHGGDWLRIAWCMANPHDGALPLATRGRQAASTASIAFSISFCNFARAAGFDQRSARSGRVVRQIVSMSSRLVLRSVLMTTEL